MEPNGYVRCFNTNCLQNIHARYLLCLFESSNCLNDEIDTFTGPFKLRLDLKNLDKYLTYGFDGQRFTGINNTNLIILGYNLYKDSLMKCRSRFWITTFLFVTIKV